MAGCYADTPRINALRSLLDTLGLPSDTSKVNEVSFHIMSGEAGTISVTYARSPYVRDMVTHTFSLPWEGDLAETVVL